MKKLFLLCAALLLSLTQARADEGMWLLNLMKQQHLEDSLRKAGLQLPPEAFIVRLRRHSASALVSLVEVARAK